MVYSPNNDTILPNPAGQGELRLQFQPEGAFKEGLESLVVPKKLAAGALSLCAFDQDLSLYSSAKAELLSQNLDRNWKSHSNKQFKLARFVEKKMDHAMRSTALQFSLQLPAPAIEALRGLDPATFDEYHTGAGFITASVTIPHFALVEPERQHMALRSIQHAIWGDSNPGAGLDSHEIPSKPATVKNSNWSHKS